MRSSHARFNLGRFPQPYQTTKILLGHWDQRLTPSLQLEHSVEEEAIKPPSNALLEKECLNPRSIPFFDGLTQFFLCPSEVGTIVRTNHFDLPSMGNEASECVYKRICSQGFSHLNVDGSTCQTGKEGAITFHLAPAPLNQDGSKIVDASTGERWLLRVNAIWWKIGHHLL